MLEGVKFKFSPYKMVCEALIWLLRPLTVPLEIFLHAGVGERYVGFSGLAAVILMATCAGWCPPGDRSLLSLLIWAFVIRGVIHRIACVRHRRRGGVPLHTRSEGKPLFGLRIGNVPPQAITWAEPLVVMFAAFVETMVNRTVGDYLLLCGAGLLAINGLRASIAYNRSLDVLDGLLEKEVVAEEIRGFELQISQGDSEPFGLVEQEMLALGTTAPPQLAN